MKKYEFIKLKIKLLDYWILAEGIIPDPDKVTAFEVLEKLNIISKLKEFLRAVNFFKKYI